MRSVSCHGCEATHSATHPPSHPIPSHPKFTLYPSTVTRLPLGQTLPLPDMKYHWLRQETYHSFLVCCQYGREKKNDSSALVTQAPKDRTWVGRERDGLNPCPKIIITPQDKKDEGRKKKKKTITMYVHKVQTRNFDTPILKAPNPTPPFLVVLPLYKYYIGLVRSCFLNHPTEFNKAASYTRHQSLFEIIQIPQAPPIHSNLRFLSRCPHVSRLRS
ncbi:uncharacterized protein F4812DRAFT_323107 [Daldinia caldariorum]|uniref:uncharacterized protein n=1 Tax=Daldinia caldariorum TaxID=326644 RepID=UPI002008EA5F|nr:uncharacterized protein F4812DRAFT_323107 [Daldinia caldariorum]KAI1469233.1 hypothetical protein F4812DRAFT_323107 [Daldinia caldariorum]